MTGCQCTKAGWCERHKMHKRPHWVHLCQTRENYFQAWEDGRGPGQLGSGGHSQLLLIEPGVGTELCKLLGRCGTFSHATELNAWGPDGCISRMDIVTGWLIEYGTQHMTAISEETARRMIMLAVDRVR